MKKLFLAVIIILSPLFYSDAFGCSCPTVGMTAEQDDAGRLKDFNSAAAVFTGEVVELEENKVKFKVERIWKGESVDEIVMIIRLKKDDGRYVRTSCDYYYELGKKYLVFAFDTKGELTTYQCTRTTSFRHTQIVEREIKGLDEIKSAEIKKNKSE